MRKWRHREMGSWCVRLADVWVENWDLHPGVSLQSPSLTRNATQPLLWWRQSVAWLPRDPSWHSQLLHPQRCGDPDQRESYCSSSNSIYPESPQSTVAAESSERENSLWTFHLVLCSWETCHTCPDWCHRSPQPDHYPRQTAKETECVIYP